ncbi:MAG: hypothetical protein KIT84_32170 [Labilithrix sp.]|nr:hypothetical protein [Labilithrix sp.]MCW5815729.1 hypothetical protein [Labilithrix sp.]
MRALRIIADQVLEDQETNRADDERGDTGDGSNERHRRDQPERPHRALRTRTTSKRATISSRVVPSWKDSSIVGRLLGDRKEVAIWTWMLMRTSNEK